MSFLAVIQLLVFLLPAEDGTEMLLPFAVLLLASLQLFLQLHLLMFHPAVNVQMLALMRAKLVQAHVFHVLELPLEFSQREAAEYSMVFLVELLDCHSEGDHFLVWFLLAHLINQPLLFDLELFEEVLDVQLFLQ